MNAIRTPVTKVRPVQAATTTPASGVLPPEKTSTPAESWGDIDNESEIVAHANAQAGGENSAFFAFIHDGSFSSNVSPNVSSLQSSNTLADLSQLKPDFVPVLTRKAKRLLRTVSRVPRPRHRKFSHLANKLIWQNNTRIKLLENCKDSYFFNLEITAQNQQFAVISAPEPAGTILTADLECANTASSLPDKRDRQDSEEDTETEVRNSTAKARKRAPPRLSMNISDDEEEHPLTINLGEDANATIVEPPPAVRAPPPTPSDASEASAAASAFHFNTNNSLRLRTNTSSPLTAR